MSIFIPRIKIQLNHENAQTQFQCFRVQCSCAEIRMTISQGVEATNDFFCFQNVLGIRESPQGPYFCFRHNRSEIWA